MPISVSLSLSVHPEKATEFKGMIKQALTETRTKPGFINISVHENQDEPGNLVLWERWESRADYDAYFNWRVETGFMDAIGPFMAAPPVKIVMSDVPV